MNIISKILIKRGFSKLVKYIHKNNQRDWTPEETIDFLYSKEGELICPWQFKEELLQLATEIHEHKPKVVVEIGTANGGTLFMSSRVAQSDALIVSIDLPGGDFGGGYPNWKVDIYKSFARPDQLIHLIRNDSHAQETFDKLKSILGDRKIDYLFIDGDHTYEGVKVDFEKYRQLLAPNSLVGFHDIVIHKGSRCNVYKFWNEIKNDFEMKEFVNDWEQNKFGVGVIKHP